MPCSRSRGSSTATSTRQTATATKQKAQPQRKSRRKVAPAHPYLSGNTLVCGDNMDVLKELPDECVDLSHIDKQKQKTSPSLKDF